MNIVKLDVEYTGSRDVLINGVNVFAGGKEARAVFEAQIFKKQLTKEQQYQMTCEICRLAAQVSATYNDMRVARGEITEAERKSLTLTL